MLILYLLLMLAFEVVFVATKVAYTYPWILVVPVAVYGAAMILWVRSKEKERNR